MGIIPLGQIETTKRVSSSHTTPQLCVWHQPPAFWLESIKIRCGWGHYLLLFKL